MRRKLTSTILTAATVFALAACAPAPPGQPWDTAEDEDSPVKACLVSDQAGFSDKSFNQSAKEGLDQAVEELHVRSAATESSGPGDFKQNIDNLIAQNCTLVFGVSYTLNDAILRAAQDNPDINFVLIDSRITKGNPPEEVDLPNAKALVFNTAEASLLAGYLAAGMSESGVVGTWGGQQIPPVSLIMDGFAEGIAYYDEETDASTRLIGWDVEKQSGSFAGGFQDQARGNQLTEGMISQGADVIMPLAGNASNGALAAARAKPGTVIIWIDSDGYETTEFGELILTSVVKHVGQSVYDTIESELNGEFSSEAYIGNLENDGVGIAPFHEFEDQVPDDLKHRISELKEEIMNGDITIETPNMP